MNSDYCVTSFNVCFWNINGVKNKFMSEITNETIQPYDIIVLTETHFNIRSKCPENFVIVATSPPTESKRPRGGVAIYKKIHCPLQFTTLLNIPDCTVCEIQNTNIVLIACYIPPNNSQYYSDELFDQLKGMIDYLYQKKLYTLSETSTPDSVI